MGTVKEEEKEDKEFVKGRRLFDIKVDEVSSVDRGANNRPFLVVKRAEMDKNTEEEVKKADWVIGGATDLPVVTGRDWDGSAAEKRIRKQKFAGGPDKEEVDFEKYSKAFIVYDASQPENFTSYKLPFADVIDGELKAVERGLIAAKQALSGARGGVNLPEDLIERSLSFVNSYLEKVENKKEKKQDREKQMEDTSVLGRLKSVLSMLDKGITELTENNSVEDESVFKESAFELSEISIELEKDYREVNEALNSERGVDRHNPNMGAGIMPDTSVVSDFKTFIEDVLKSHEEIKEVEKLEEKIEKLESELKTKNEFIEELEEKTEKLSEFEKELTKLKKRKELPKSDPELDQDATKEEPKKVVWALDMNKK